MAKKKGLKISCTHRDTYYRAGLEITRNGIDVPLDSLKKAQIDAINADRNLRVVEITIDDGKGDAGGKDDGKDDGKGDAGGKPA